MKNSDKPAYPEHYLNQDREDNYSLGSEGGLTKREYFAGLAMQGILANSEHAFNGANETAIWAAQNADALLKALEESE